MVPLVAIVGRPNVGKSTLFNRLAKRRRALVAHEAGLTRDRHYALTEWENRQFQVVDTGGFESDSTDDLVRLIRMQTETAVAEADLVLLLFDARAGLTSTDRDLVSYLRRAEKRVIVVANKVDGPKQDSMVAEIHELGYADVCSVSAEHGRGFDELLDVLLAQLPPADAERPTTPIAEVDEAPIRVALVGRPNAGKSALLNRLLGEQRSIVSDLPGTTRDPIDAPLQTAQGSFVLVDTAGIRRKRRAAPFMEQLAVLHAQRIIHEADIACLLIDASQPLAMQDAKIASLAVETGRGLVLVLTKSDLLGPLGPARRELTQQLEQKLRFAQFAPQVLLSALHGKNVHKLLPTVRRVHEQCGHRIQTAELNRFFEQLTAEHPPPSHQGRPVRLYYITQAQVRPPTFVISASRPKAIPDAYRRYLANRIRERFSFEGAPLRLFFRGKKRER